MRRIAILAMAGAAIGCPARARGPSTTASSIEVSRAGSSLRGVAADTSTTFVSLAGPAGPSRVEARRAGNTLWIAELAGSASLLARAGAQVAAIVAGTDTIQGVAVRGAPAFAVVGLGAERGTPAFVRPFESSEWVIATAIAPAGDDLLVAGSFSGSLRAAARIVSSGGRSDGFVARISPTGDVRWLVRAGGPGADAMQGVTAAGDRIAVAGTFAPGADFHGEPLESVDDKTPYADGFVAELDAAGRVKWTATFGSKLDDSVAGVAIDGKGRVALAANAREVTRIGSAELVAAGPADGFVAYWTPAGTLAGHVLLGGRDFDGLRAIAAVGDRVVVGGFFSGNIVLGATTLTARGGDDSFVAALDGDRVVRAWAVSGEGREEVVALVAVPGGFAAAIAYTADALLDGAALPAPKDPLGGGAVLVRPVD